MNEQVLLTYKVAELKRKFDALEKELDQVKADRIAEQRKRLLWGIGALGSAVMALAGAIWAMLPHSAQEAWEVLRGGAR
jgi:DNA-binding IclR family transcriptional regulator